MPRIADYNTIPTGSGIDAGVTISFPGSPLLVLEFHVEPGAHFSSRSVLAFVLRSNNSVTAVLQVRVNTDEAVIYTIPRGNHVKSLHEIIGSGVLHAGPHPNVVEFRIEALPPATPSFRISDVVITYQREI